MTTRKSLTKNSCTTVSRQHLSSDLADLSAEKNRGAPITMWIVGDLDSLDGQAMINDALTHVQVSRDHEHYQIV